MNGKAPRASSARSQHAPRKPPLGKPWGPGQSGNPSGKSKQLAEIEALARSKCPEAIEALARLARGKGLPAVRAAETLLLFGLGRPAHQLAITAKGGGGAGGAPAFAGAARALIEAAIERAEGSVTVPQTVADGDPATGNASHGAVIDVTVEPAAVDRGQALADPTSSGGDAPQAPGGAP